MSWLIRLFSRSEPCDHAKNHKTRKWLAPCGTPMQEFRCFDCGFADVGHVYADSNGWTPVLVVKRGGVEEYRREG